MRGCDKFIKSGICHCQLYGNSTDANKKKILKAIDELKGQCCCDPSGESICRGYETHILYSETVN